MATASNPSSNAFNFASHIQHGVDPRTGLLMFRMDLSGRFGSDLLSPELELHLRYSQLSQQDRGFGNGWSLSLTEYDMDPERRIISLANGETFKVDGRVGSSNQLSMSEKKIDTFHLYEDSANVWRVVHRSGVVEVLERKGGGKNARAVPTRIYSRQGHWLTLEYKLHDQFPLLSKIRDMRGGTLLEITREGRTVQLKLPTDSKSALYTLVFEAESYRVRRIELPTDNLASWRFTYALKRGMECISEIRTPTGAFEELFYDDGGHLFPNRSGLDPLPRVTRHLRHPHPGQNKATAIDTRYTYSSNGHNFLGGNADLDWKDDGLDNLFRKTIDYDYATTETLWVGNQPVRSTVREFNKFHLSTSEAIYRGGRLNGAKTEVVGPYVETKTTEYTLKNGLFIDQVNYCQLPTKVQKRWWDQDSGRTREEEVVSEFDDYGNVLMQKKADGIVERYTWYKQAEDGYPGNDEKFVCDMKSKTVTPAAGHQGNAPTLVTRYRYKVLPKLASSRTDTRQERWLALHSETTTAGVSELKSLTYDYYENAHESPVEGTPLLHGRLEESVTRFPNPRAGEAGQPDTLDTAVKHSYQFTTLIWDKMRDPRLQALAPITVLESVQTMKGFDDSSMQTSEGHSLLTGELLLSIDQDKVERRTVQDELRRPLFEVVAGGSESEAVRSNTYTLCANEQDRASQRFTETRKVATETRCVVTETRYDGFGRVDQAYKSHVDPAKPASLFLVRELLHDAWDREVEDRQYDWLAGQAFPADGQFLARRYLYDRWDARNVVIREDNVQEHVAFDPTEKDADNNVRKVTWLQVAQQTLKSEKLSTWSNAFDKPVRIERLGLDDAVIAEQTQSYDGLGHCIVKTDERQHATGFEYDAFGRMTANVLADDTRIEYSYADQSEQEWTVSIRAISTAGSEPPFEVGAQQFNGVGQLTSRMIGKRLEKYVYKPDQSAPEARVTGAGDSVAYRYNLALTPFPTHSTVGIDTTEYTYNPVTGLLEQALNAEGDRLYNYNEHDQLTQEVWRKPDGSELPVAYVTTLQNHLKSRTQLGDMTTVHEYDERGRIKATDEGNLLATFEYSLLGRLAKVTSKDKTSGSELVTTLEYDEHGFECKRTQQLDQQPARTLVQQWGKDKMLDGRLLREGRNILLKEQFTYDRRGRLSIVAYSGSQLPADEAGRKISKQVFRYDSIDNILRCQTTFADTSAEMATYTYKEADRFLLDKLTLTTAGTTASELTFSHDDNGNLKVDQHGRELAYDAESRLLQIVGHSHYRYDGEGRLLTSQAGSEVEKMLWFNDNRLSLAIQGATRTRYSFHADMPLAQQGELPGPTLLLQTDASHSVIAECEAGTVRDIQYSAFGQRHATAPLHSHLAYHGEALDLGSDWYMLGAGVRAYNPGLRRFNSPDPRSVFETGELNPYSYCLNNPVALRDPSGYTATGSGGRPRRPDENDPNWLGRSSGGGGFMKWIWVAIAVVATIAAVATAGTALAALGAFGPAAATAVLSAKAAVAAAATGGAAATVGQTILASAAGTTMTAAVIKTATAALAVAGTAAQTVAAISGDTQAESWAQYLGLAAVGVGVVSGVRSLGSMVARALSPEKFDTASKLGKSMTESMAKTLPPNNGSRLQLQFDYRNSTKLHRAMGHDRFKNPVSNN